MDTTNNTNAVAKVVKKVPSSRPAHQKQNTPKPSVLRQLIKTATKSYSDHSLNNNV